MRWFYLLLLCPAFAWAAEIPDTRMLVAKMGGGLLLVLVLVGLLAWAVKRVSGLSRSQGLMKVRGTLMLGPRERLVWVDVSGEQLLLGVSQGRIELLRKLDSSTESLDEAVTPEDKGSFAEKLQVLMGARNA